MLGRGSYLRQHGFHRLDLAVLTVPAQPCDLVGVVVIGSSGEPD
jgi:hypothetical protein